MIRGIVHRAVAQRDGHHGQALDRQSGAQAGLEPLGGVVDRGQPELEELLVHLVAHLVGVGAGGPAAALQLHRLCGHPLGQFGQPPERALTSPVMKTTSGRARRPGG